MKPLRSFETCLAMCMLTLDSQDCSLTRCSYHPGFKIAMELKPGLAIQWMSKPISQQILLVEPRQPHKYSFLRKYLEKRS